MFFWSEFGKMWIRLPALPCSYISCHVTYISFEKGSRLSHYVDSDVPHLKCGTYVLTYSSCCKAS